MQSKERPNYIGTVVALLLVAMCIYGLFAGSQGDAKREEARIVESRQAYAEENNMVVVGNVLVPMTDLSRSAAFTRVGYDEDSEILVVQFRESEAVYAYYDVPFWTIDELLDAESPGAYYNAKIKGSYESERINR